MENRFDKEAKEWDKNERRIKLAEAVSKAMIDNLDKEPGFSLLDFGTGTGLILFSFKELAGKLTGVDSSDGMIETLKEKAADDGVEIDVVKCNIDKDELPADQDVITASMVLHHLPAPETFIRKAYSALNSGGTIMIADLDEKGGGFHDHEQFVHDGFSESTAKNMLEKAGFSHIRFSTVHKITKMKDGIEKEFDIFLAVAEK